MRKICDLVKFLLIRIYQILIYAERAENTIPERGIIPVYLLRLLNLSAP
uniref:Uncharacterized protein n=1 Tax=Podoviridae sp. ct4s49 TaxID=2823555 RepID=A0A8S5LEE4_9CAUD|nr:MAG TPA: hypothetical protein [Podoviridae sp. ct4s49]DAM33191.1 MAG TPA: hypothetical protein [Caudoviricetes sp.]